MLLDDKMRVLSIETLFERGEKASEKQSIGFNFSSSDSSHFASSIGYSRKRRPKASIGQMIQNQHQEFG
jgi:hypothetical protein